MNRNEALAAVVEAIGGAERLVGQIERSQRLLATLMPLTVERLRAFDDMTWDSLYAFQMKFLLLQDLATRRLMRGFLALTGEDVRELSMREAVDRAAELGSLTSGDDWLDLAIVRNMLAHDYPVDLAQFIQRIDDAFTRCDRLVENVRLLIAAFSHRKLL